MPYTPELKELIKIVEKTRPERVAKKRAGEEIPFLSLDERKERLKFHPDFKEEGRRELKVGPSKGYGIAHEIADLLEAVGFDVHREYYVNDAGRQMDILGTSVWLRYLELCGETLVFPSNGYKGDYVWDIGASLHRKHGDALHHRTQELFDGVPADEADGGDKELHIDALVSRSKKLLGQDSYREVFDLGLDSILENIRRDLEEFGVHYDAWFSERSLTGNGSVQRAIERLKLSGHVYEKGGAQWFRSSAFGDEKDRVLVRENGQTTYFASDIAYHMDKLERGFDRVIDVWGADHHGYIPRMKAAVAASGVNPENFQVILVQLVNLLRAGAPVAMSTRAGEFVTLQDVVNEVGSDAARFLFLTRHYDSPLDFDLEVAKQKSNDNPVYYVQYVHARIASICRKAEIDLPEGAPLDPQALSTLTDPEDVQLIKQLNRYPDTVQTSARFMEPHRVTFYLMTLAWAFHSYYNRQRVLTDDPITTKGRLYLVTAVQKVIRNGLALLGVSAPDHM